MKILLFDIDGTLVLSGGAGFRAMNRAFEQLWGISDALNGVQLAGRTDGSIIEDALRTYDVRYKPEEIDQYKMLYFDLLKDEIARPVENKLVMPGVRDLLEALAKRADVYLGLLTGNWQESARIKLTYFKLDPYFTFGAFSDDSGLRDDLVPFATQRFSGLHNLSPKPNEVYVIGDTPADIRCAKPHGAISVAVGAAHYSAAQLKIYNPDHLFKDLTDTKALLKLLG